MDQILQELILKTEDKDLITKKEALRPCLEELDRKDYALFKSSFLVYLSNTVRLKNKYDDVDTKNLLNQLGIADGCTK